MQVCIPMVILYTVVLKCGRILLFANSWQGLTKLKLVAQKFFAENTLCYLSSKVYMKRVSVFLYVGNFMWFNLLKIYFFPTGVPVYSAQPTYGLSTCGLSTLKTELSFSCHMEGIWASFLFYFFNLIFSASFFKLLFHPSSYSFDI